MSDKLQVKKFTDFYIIKNSEYSPITLRINGEAVLHLDRYDTAAVKDLKKIERGSKKSVYFYKNKKTNRTIADQEYKKRVKELEKKLTWEKNDCGEFQRIDDKHYKSYQEYLDKHESEIQYIYEWSELPISFQEYAVDSEYFKRHGCTIEPIAFAGQKISKFVLKRTIEYWKEIRDSITAETNIDLQFRQCNRSGKLDEYAKINASYISSDERAELSNIIVFEHTYGDLGVLEDLHKNDVAKLKRFICREKNTLENTIKANTKTLITKYGLSKDEVLDVVRNTTLR